MLEPLVLATIRWGSVVSLLIASVALMGSPGPATISLTAVASAYGVRRSLPYLLGIVIGTALVLIAVATGITATLVAVPGLRAALIAISVSYILWLAYRVATAPSLSDAGDPSRTPSFAGATVLAVANPKAWIALAAVFASARLNDAATSDAAAKLVLLSAMIVVLMSAWLLVGASLAPLLRNPRHARIVNMSLAGSLVAASALAIVH